MDSPLSKNEALLEEVSIQIFRPLGWTENLDC